MASPDELVRVTWNRQHRSLAVTEDGAKGSTAIIYSNVNMYSVHVLAVGLPRGTTARTLGISTATTAT